MPADLQKPSTEVLEPILQTYKRGRTIDALRLAEAIAPLQSWAGVEGCTLASRLAVNTGAQRLSTRLTVRGWRTDKTHPLARAQFAFELTSRRGPVALWLAMREWPACRHTTPEEEADLLALQGNVATDLRDFSSAEALLSRAEALGPREPWVHLQRAHLLERQDRVEEGLEVARAATLLHPHPFYRPGVQLQAHLLQLLDRDEDAIQLLAEAGSVLQNGPVCAQLYSLLTEHGRWREAEGALERFVELSPLLEPGPQKWVTSQRARVAYHLGKRAEAARFAGALEDPFHQGFAANLSNAPVDRERVQLGVGFVRQHFKTCAPASLAALGRYWRMPAEHLQMAEAMCYDGTPHWQQRQWAEQNGWLVREFRVTEEVARTLLTRGVPFVVSTVEATSAHMQAVVGYDRVRNTLLLRDPGQPYVAEVPANEFLGRYRAFGPHGTVFLPVAERGRMEGIVLPDSEIYDACHQLWLALVKHDRASAARIVSEIESKFPGHALAWQARLDLATYDANATEQARCLDELLGLFPNNAARLLRRFACLRETSGEEQIRFLEAAVAKGGDPALLIELARALQGDARRLPEAQRWLKRALRCRPFDSGAIAVSAGLFWQEGKLEPATELYRFAANLEGFREELYQAWFRACQRTRRTAEAMAHLEDRFARFGARSEQPALTLAWAWGEMEQPVRGREVLAQAAGLRPMDALLKLRSASLVARLGEPAEAARLLEETGGRVRKNDWLRTAAEIAEYRLDITMALQHCRELLQLEPFALDAHHGVARCLCRLEGTAAALAHFRKTCGNFPHHYGLRRMLVEYSENSAPEAFECAARDLVRLDKADAWARRELAVALCRLRRLDEALAEAEEATRIEPNNTFSHSVLGHVHLRRAELTEARARFQRAVELSVDNGDAIHSLLDLAANDKQRRDELAFVENELIRQVVLGDGLLAFIELASPLLEPEKLLSSLRHAHRERPDLWHAWSALISQLGHLGQLDEARELAREAVAKFPHLPRVWLDLAMVCQWRKEPEEEIKAAEHAFEMNPAWSRATLALAGVLERSGRMEEARKIYERALRHSPEEAELHASHGHLLWRLRQPEAALKAVEHALRLAPGCDWAWELLMDWAATCGTPDRPAQFARTLSSERPGEVKVWLMLARVLTDPASAAERLGATDRALELEPRCTEAWDLKAEFLAQAERFAESIQACEAGANTCTADLYVLQGRRAWIEARRRQFPEAVRRMRLVLEENASYLWGWNQLTHWLLEQNQTAEAASALEQLLRLRPRDPWVHRQLGFLRQKQDDRAGAQQAFANTLQLCPTDAFAAQNLFDSQLEAGDLDAAASTLEVMQTHQPGDRTAAAEVFLNLRRRNWATAKAGFEQLCASPDPDAWPVASVTDAFKQAGRAQEAVDVLQHGLRQPSINPEVAAALIRLLLDADRNVAAVFRFLKLSDGEVQLRAAAPLVQGLVRNKQKVLLRFLLWRRSQVLASDDAAWGQVGYALSTFNRMAAVADWLSDWRGRDKVEPWMLFNLCLAFRELGRYEEATRLARHVLKEWGHREGSADLRLFLAVEAALTGEVKEAREQLREAVIRKDVDYDRELLTMAEAVAEFLETPPSERRLRFRTTRQTLSERFTAWGALRAMKDVRRTFRRSGEIIAREGGGWQARSWFWWKLNWHWVVLPMLIPLFLGAAFKAPLLFVVLLWGSVRAIRRC